MEISPSLVWGRYILGLLMKISGFIQIKVFLLFVMNTMFSLSMKFPYALLSSFDAVMMRRAVSKAVSFECRSRREAIFWHLYSSVHIYWVSFKYLPRTIFGVPGMWFYYLFLYSVICFGDFIGIWKGMISYLFIFFE